jgi:hypothetical protein
VRKQLAQFIEIVSEREKKLARLASGFVFLLAKPEFYLHLTSWQVPSGYPHQWYYDEGENVKHH